MKIINKPQYQCDHCKKLYRRKGACEAHEPKCSRNPINFRPCFDCDHLTKKNHTVYNDHPMGGEIDKEVHLMYCKKKEMFIHPPSVEHKNNAIELGDEFNEPMPKECDLFEDELPF